MFKQTDQDSFKRIFKELGGFTAELLKVVLISLAIILPIRYYVVQPFYVKGASMEPSFFDNEYLLIDEISYQFHNPGRGDVVVFRYPRDPSQFFIKRVIGLPGEKVFISQGEISIKNKNNPQGFVLAEPYLESVFSSVGDFEMKIPADSFFLLGDNRSASLDSRVFGPVEERYIVGRVWLRAWPFDRWTLFSQDSATMTYSE